MEQLLQATVSFSQTFQIKVDFSDFSLSDDEKRKKILEHANYLMETSPRLEN